MTLKEGKYKSQSRERKRVSRMDILDEFRKRVLERLDSAGEWNEAMLREFIFQEIEEEKVRYPLILEERIFLARRIFDSIHGLDILQDLLRDQEVTEIMINGCDDVFVEKKGRILRYGESFSSRERLEQVIQQIVSRINRRVNETTPIADARLQDGSRVHVVLPPVALNGPIVTIRRFPERHMTMDELVQIHSITEEAAVFLKLLVRGRYNIFISGGTGSGKTTFLNVLSNFIPADERVITIEDSAELQITQIENLVRLESRPPNAEGANEVSIRNLIKAALRMRPDRIIVGEVRGEEALDMLQAMNTGHDGSLSTGHGNSPDDMIKRLETMVLMAVDMPVSAIRSQISSGIDIIVHLGRLRDKSRRVLRISEVCGMDKGEIKINTLYAFEECGESNGIIEGKLVSTGKTLWNQLKLKQAGLEKEMEELCERK